MAKGYWVAHVDVQDPTAYQEYIKRNGVAFAKYGARYVVRNGTNEVVEGKLKSRHVVIEFDTYEKALACYRSPEYQEATGYRLKASSGDIVIIEGYDGPQPG